MQTRRDFLKLAASLSGAAGLSAVLPRAIQKAHAIAPEPGTTYLDAEHVVILMQENRSFDHAYGTLQGVRGYNDPRAITLPDGNPVWVQTDAAGNSYAPFRLNIKDTVATWMGSLPHSWTDQVDARNQGRYDRWLQAKQSGHKPFAGMPLTLGYYNRDDIPFYYALADAFTVCDQNFCSCLTGTTPNRLHLWTGTIREKPSVDSPAEVLNSNVDYEHEAHWTTFPERLEDAGISWKIYQNELSLDVGLGESAAWLANFGDNPIEHFVQYNVRYSEAYRRQLKRLVETLPGEIAALEKQVAAPDATPQRKAAQRKLLDQKVAYLAQVKAALPRWTQENYEKLSPREKSLHAKAFSTNTADSAYHELETLKYRDGDVDRELQVPKGDLFHQFRQDVEKGTLPTVSWLVAPENFSDHPSSAWFGAWYIAEALDILTKNPAVWKKTIFILTYDENDGYFDHVPPFVAPDPRRPETGRVSPKADATLEFVELAQELKRKPAKEARESSIGLGYRVPLVIASPWSRGGCVCSQVFDHTSVLQFLEKLLTHRSGKKIEETNINPWRRAVCGDLTSAFEPYAGEAVASPPVPERNAFVEQIHKARFKGLPSDYKRLTAEEIEQIRQQPRQARWMPSQEPGVRRSSPLPYELQVDGALSQDRRGFAIEFAALDKLFGPRAAGSPFVVYYRAANGDVLVRNYAVAAGEKLRDTWPLADFKDGRYHLAVHGPNGFFREFKGSAEDPKVGIRFDASPLVSADGTWSGHVALHVQNDDPRNACTLLVQDRSYGGAEQQRELAPGESGTLLVVAQSSFGWYDVSVRLVGSASAQPSDFEQRYAGRVETGQWSYSDPAMAGVAT